MLDANKLEAYLVKQRGHLNELSDTCIDKDRSYMYLYTAVFVDGIINHLKEGRFDLD
jgi:hypothetical protein